MMPRSVSHDRQRSAGILSRRSSPNSTSCPDPTSAAIRKHLPPAPLVNCGPSGTRAVTRPLDRTGAVRHHWSQTDHHIVCWCHTASGGQVVSPAPASGRAQRAALAIDTSSSNSLGSVDNRLHRQHLPTSRSPAASGQARRNSETAHTPPCAPSGRVRDDQHPDFARELRFRRRRTVALRERTHAMTLLTTSFAASCTSARCSGPLNDSA
jgi:Cft2 family RNA processing exonuclease